MVNAQQMSTPCPGSWATAALVQLLMAALMVTEFTWHPVGMAPLLLEALSSFTLQCCMPGKTKETVTDNKIQNGRIWHLASQVLEQVSLESWGFWRICSLHSKSLGEHSPCNKKWQAEYVPMVPQWLPGDTKQMSRLMQPLRSLVEIVSAGCFPPPG